MRLTGLGAKRPTRSTSSSLGWGGAPQDPAGQAARRSGAAHKYENSLAALKIRFILCGAHQMIQFSGIGEFHYQHPTILVRTIIDEFRGILQRLIRLHHLAAEG